MGVTYGQIKDWVLALPGTSEVFVDRWDEYSLRAGEKIIVIGASDRPSATVKASVQDQAELLAGSPDTYAKAAYVGRYGWVTVTLATAEAEQLRRVVEDAWRATAPKKVVRVYDSAQA